METKFQRLTPIFGVQQFNETRRNTVTCNRKLQVQDGDRQTGSIHISGSTQDRDEISRANYMFSRSTIQIIIILTSAAIAQLRKQDGD
jgi:hypothetical protein